MICSTYKRLRKFERMYGMVSTLRIIEINHKENTCVLQYNAAIALCSSLLTDFDCKCSGLPPIARKKDFLSIRQT